MFWGVAGLTVSDETLVAGASVDEPGTIRRGTLFVIFEIFAADSF